MDPSTRGSDAIGGLAAALLAAGVLVAGPGVAVAVGDPGPRHSHSRDGRDSSERDGRGGREGGKSQRDARDGRDRSERGESERGDPGRDQRRGNRDHDDSASGDRRPEGEWVPSDPSDVPIPEAFAPEPAVQAPTARVAARASAAGETPQSPSVSAGDTDESDGGGSGGRGGGASQAAGSFVSPRVVVGNGRVPGEGSIDRVEPPVVQAPTIPSNVEPPAPVVTPAQPPSAPPPPAPVSPVDQSSEAAPPLMTAPPTTGGISAMWGLAGLLLAPLAGIWLGYRQARATKAADQLTTSLAGG